MKKSTFIINFMLVHFLAVIYVFGTVLVNGNTKLEDFYPLINGSTGVLVAYSYLLLFKSKGNDKISRLVSRGLIIILYLWLVFFIVLLYYYKVKGSGETLDKEEYTQIVNIIEGIKMFILTIFIPRFFPQN